MLFNSLHFFLFFPIVFFTYYAINSQKIRLLILLISSSYFYSAFIPQYLLILYFIIIIDYFSAIYIEKYPNKKKILLLISLITNIGILFFFKYFNFFTNSNLLNIILPIGLSFHTFQALSYIIEVYRGHQKPEKSLITYSVYVMFFPQLVAGPIERPQNILPQLNTFQSFNYENVVSGLKIMLIGFFSKVMIADWIAGIANYSFSNTENLSGPVLFLGIVSFSIQIYCDFFGYSLIAIGSARVFGINLMKNFNSPYIAKSISEFWRRWHISLSTWFKDYVYIPLGGNRKFKIRNIMIVFILSGLWHGAAWTYVIWGLLHGIYIYIETITKKPFNIFTTYILVLLSWIFFRAENINMAFLYFKRLFLNWDQNIVSNINDLIKYSLTPKLELTIVLISIVIIYYLNIKGNNIFDYIEKKNRYVKWFFYLSITITMIIFGKLINPEGQFIYFQF